MKRSLHHHRSPTSDSVKNLSKTDSDSLIIQPFTHGARCYAFHPSPHIWRVGPVPDPLSTT
jgi:hypothetical protein